MINFQAIKRFFSLSRINAIVVIGQIFIVTPLFFGENQIIDVENGSIFLGISVVLFCIGLFLKRYDSVYRENVDMMQYTHPILFWWGIIFGTIIGLLGYAGITTFLHQNLNLSLDASSMANLFFMLISVSIVPLLYLVATGSRKNEGFLRSVEPFVSKLSSNLMIPASYAMLSMVYEIMLQQTFVFSVGSILMTMVFTFLLLAGVYIPVHIHEMVEDPYKNHYIGLLKTLAILTIHLMVVQIF